jgi:predicted DNA-binding transcriptional regulator AlpA
MTKANPGGRDPADVLLFTDDQRELLGGVSHMWLKRKAAIDPSFPKAHYIGRRPGRWRSEMLAWIERQPQTRAAPQSENLKKVHSRPAASGPAA